MFQPSNVHSNGCLQLQHGFNSVHFNYKLQKNFKDISVFNPLTPGAFCKKCGLDILVVFRLDLGQISFSLVENAFCNTTACLSCH